MKKDTFILNVETLGLINKLTDEQAGVVFKNIMRYQANEVLINMDIASELVFEALKITVDKYNTKYEETCKKRAEAGKLGGYAKASKSKQNVANASKSKQNVANVADNDNDNEYEYDNDNDYEYMGERNIKRELPPPPPPFVPPTLDEVKEYISKFTYSVDPERFYFYYLNNGWTVRGKQMTDWKKKVRDWHIDDRNILPEEKKRAKIYSG